MNNTTSFHYPGSDLRPGVQQQAQTNRGPMNAKQNKQKPAAGAAGQPQQPKPPKPVLLDEDNFGRACAAMGFALPGS